MNASPAPANRDTLTALMTDSKSRGAARAGFFHHGFVRDAAGEPQPRLDSLKDDA